MIVYAECEFFIPTAHSLKEKRAVLQRMLTRTKQKYNVSIAELDHQDVWQRTTIAMVAICFIIRMQLNESLHHAITFLRVKSRMGMYRYKQRIFIDRN